MIERAGFDFAFMSGFCTSAARLGAPDTGLLSYGEMVDQGRYIHEATKRIPIIGDGDTGYGNAMNIKRTVRGYAAAGFAGILLEDQVWPKSCGHVKGKRVTSREEAVSRIRAAADARNEGADILILARSDARQAESLDEALWRAAAFADAGADILFIDALASVDEMKAFTALGGAAAKLPKMANMLEGGGKTPILAPEELQALGFSLVAYPLSLLGVSIRAMENALTGLKSGRVPGVRDMGTFVDIQMAVGFPEYFEEEERYAVRLPTASTTTHSTQTPPQQQAQQPSSTSSFAASSSSGAQAASSAAAPQHQQSAQQEPASTAAAAAAAAAPDVVEADEVVPPSDSSSGSSSGSGGGGSGSSFSLTVGPDGKQYSDSERQARWDAFRRSKFFKVCIKDKRTNMMKLETRIPAGFIGGLTALVPQVAGVNFEEMVEAAVGEKLDLNKPIVDYESGNDIITVWLE